MDSNIEEMNYSWQECQDEHLMYKFQQLHKFIINKMVNFCKVHNIQIDKLTLIADGLHDSIEFGEWQPSTDSCLEFIKFNDKKEEKVKPFLMSV